MTSATPRVIKAAHCAAIRTPASRTNSTTIGIRATSAESARFPATGSYTCWYIRSYPLDLPTRTPLLLLGSCQVCALAAHASAHDIASWAQQRKLRARAGEAQVVFDGFLAWLRIVFRLSRYYDTLEKGSAPCCRPRAAPSERNLSGFRSLRTSPFSATLRNTSDGINGRGGPRQRSAQQATVARRVS